MVKQKALIVIIPIAVAAVLGFFIYEKVIKPRQSAPNDIDGNAENQPSFSPAWDDFPGGDEEDGLILENNVKPLDDANAQANDANVAPPRPMPTDDELKEAAALFSDSPFIKLLLSQDAPLTLLVKAIDMLACGESPTDLFSFIGAFKPFRASVGSDGYLAATPETYSRFTPIVNSLVSIPPKNAAQWYLVAEPRLQAILDELGFTDAPIRQKLTQAITTILQIPDFDFAPELAESASGTYYIYKDDTFNGLNDAQKAIVRLGCGNCANIKSFAKNIAAELKLFE